MQNSKVRRQNSSCDQCRRSKRRCALPSASNQEASKSCLNCTHLGHRCTFEFAVSRAELKKRKAAGFDALPTPKQTSVRPQPLSNYEVTGIDQDAAFPAYSAQPPDPSGMGGMLWTGSDFFGYDMVMGDIGTNSWSDPDTTGRLVAQLAPAVFAATENEDSRTQELVHSKNPSKDSWLGKGALTGFWHGSPVHLLNSNFSVNLLNKNLRSICDTMVLGLASRYLAYKCNPYAKENSYHFDSERDDQGLVTITRDNDLATDALTLKSTPDLSSPESSLGTPRVDISVDPQRAAQQIDNITLYGVVRFLDNFGKLYGNRLTKQHQKQDSETLITVLQAYALQWLPCDQASSSPLVLQPQNSSLTNNTNMSSDLRLYVTAWYNAYNCILKSRDHKSFIRLYALFMFNMTSVPQCLSFLDGEEPNQLLDHGLRQVEDLCKLVEAYYQQLQIGATYRTLLESCVQIFRWYGYVRDSISSILCDKDCVIKDVPIQTQSTAQSTFPPPVGDWQELSILDAGIPEACQRSIVDVFQLYRHAIKLRKHLRPQNGPIDIPSVNGIMISAKATVKKFDAENLRWLDQCLANFTLLSRRSRVSTAFLVLFWALGAFSMAEWAHEVQKLELSSKTSNLAAEVWELRKGVVGTFSVVVKYAAEAPIQEALGASSGFMTEVPFIANHPNTDLTVRCLEKGIRHIIELNTMARSTTTWPAVVEDPTWWMRSLKPFLSCLSDLSATLTGYYSANSALQSLMFKYGDILMDCWSSFEDDGS